MLSMENIKTTRPMKKLDVRQSGPFKILSIIGTHAYKLKLPDSAKIHDVFHVSLLRPFTSPTYPGQYLEPPTPIETEQDLEYEVSAIIDSRLSHSGKLEYLVEWLGYEGTQDHVSWEPIDNLSGSTDHITSFHLANPLKPSAPKPTARRGSPRKR